MSRIGGFPDADEPLDDRGRELAARVVSHRQGTSFFCSPRRAARETAEAMGVIAQAEEALEDMSAGRWAGLRFDQIHESDRNAFDAWLQDPSQGAPDGETLSQAQKRIGLWLDRLPQARGQLCAVTHPMMVRAALMHALHLSPRAALAIDIAPLCAITLSHNRIWRLQSLTPHN